MMEPASLPFGQQPVKSGSAAQTITLVNSQNIPLQVGSITIKSSSGASAADDFVETDNCLGSVAPGSSCTINVIFTPAAAGAVSATLQIHDNLNATAGGAKQHPQKIALAGNGVVPVTVSTHAIAFHALKVGGTSASKHVKVVNRLEVPITLTGITADGDFQITSNTCGNELAASQSCKIGLAFGPTAPGQQKGSLTITDSANAEPVTVSLKGSGS
jgi:hypothetical protein